ncbi:hypothetical protein SCLCIDRAFT_34337 [Scleroderma citrinum Foug A]|uniref:Uncharacterized protein n=1 Tax=Scleroderma citrinum Foug A TaxID=1036808 RepID=A0A0C3CP47_9AGAM|nr:hypothetical protein SCLCIDRAFT_34337 [Scleroderma citrinum Foug A]
MSITTNERKRVQREYRNEFLQAVDLYKKQQKKHHNSLHAAKRSLVNDLGLKDSALPYATLAQTIPDLMVIHCTHCMNSEVASRGTILVNTGNEDLCAAIPSASYIAVPAPGDDWYVVTPNKSAIFISKDGNVELVVIRNCCGSQPDILDYVNEVISEAVNDCKGAHPNHGGELIQYGWNAGPRHAHVFGLVKNMTCKKLTADEQHKKDGDILGILALTWNLLTSTLPEKVIVPIKAAIKAAGLSPMAYKDDAIKEEDGAATVATDLPLKLSKDDIKEYGYYLDLPIGHLNFGTGEQAPSEAYMSQNYTAYVILSLSLTHNTSSESCVVASPVHQDNLYAPYALNWVTKHRVFDLKAANIDHSNTHSPGGNYVDLSLRVVVHCAPDTAMCLCPKYKHGITLARPGVWRQGTAINFSTHIKSAYDVAVASGGIQLTCGAA